MLRQRPCHSPQSEMLLHFPAATICPFGYQSERDRRSLAQRSNPRTKRIFAPPDSHSGPRPSQTRSSLRRRSRQAVPENSPAMRQSFRASPHLSLVKQSSGDGSLHSTRENDLRHHRWQELHAAPFQPTLAALPPRILLHHLGPKSER